MLSKLLQILLNKAVPIWDYDERKNIKGSLDYIRFDEVWRVVLSGNVDVTDKKGIAYFKEFMIERGPEAYYKFKYSVKINNYNSILFSESKGSYIFSNVFKLESLNNYEQFGNNQPHVPLKIQPAVKITNFNKLPIEGKRI